MKLAEKQISPVDIQSRKDISIQSGDRVRVHQKIIVDKNKSRIQVFEGLVISAKHGTEAGATFTVRRVGTDGIAVEKIFPLYSPMIDAVEVVRRGKVRRSRLYFLREMTPKNVRSKLRRAVAIQEKTVSESKKGKEEVVVDKNVVADVSTEDMKEEGEIEEIKKDEDSAEIKQKESQDLSTKEKKEE